jgi:pilus assembly protein FimV
MAIDKNTVAKEAQKFTAKGQYDKAIAEWKKLLRETPHDANLYNTIGDLCLKKNSKAEAVDAYRRAADILAQDGFTSKAIALYKKVLNIDNNQAEVHLALGDMHAEKGLTGNALENYKYVADLYTQQKDMVKALRVYQKMADLNPANLAFRIKLADMYVKQGMNAEASAAYLNAADVHIENNAFKDARQIFEKILAFDSNNKAVYFKAGILYLKEGKFNEACKALKPVYEKDPSNRELADTYAEALSKAGKDQEAEQVIKKVLAEDPSRSDLQEKLYEMYLGKKDYDRALEMASILTTASVGRDDEAGAEGYLKKFIAACPHFSPGRRKLAEFYVAVRRDDDAAQTFLQVAEILSDEGDRDGAKEALDKALDINPGMPEARDLLEHLSSEISRPEVAEEIPEQAFSPVGLEQPHVEPVLNEAADTAYFEIPSNPPAAGPGYEAPAEPASVQELPVETPVVEAAPAVPQEDPSIAEAFTEADVLIKYGLAMKAVEQLEGLARKFPDSTQVRIKLHDVYGDLGQMNKAAAHMLALSDIYAGRGMQNEAQEVLRSALAIAPDNAEVMSRLGMSPQPGSPSETETSDEARVEAVLMDGAGPGLEEPQASDERDRVAAPPRNAEIFGEHEPAPMDMNVFEGLDAEAPESERAAAPSGFEEQLPAETQPPDSELSVSEVGQPLREEPVFTADIAAQEVEPQPQAEEAEEVELEPHAYIEETSPPVEELTAYKKHPGASQEPLQREPEAPIAGPDIDEIWSEAEFYYQQGLFNEAKKHYAKIIGLNPDEARAIDRLSEISREEADTKEFTRLADAVESLEEAITTDNGVKELPLSTSDEDAVRNLMSEIAELKKTKKKPAPVPPPKPMLEVEYIPPPPPKQETPSWRPVAPISEEESRDEISGPPDDVEVGRRFAPPPQLRVTAPSRSSPVNGRSVYNKPAPPAEEEEFFDLGEALQKESAASAPVSKDSSGDFFDLASELRDELSSISVPSRPAAAEEQSLDEIFEEFKRGVEQQTSKEEADTHYNLGVAYKEMGLLDDAIEEFSLTPQGEPKFMHSRYLLGLCYMEKGEYTNAVQEIDYALTYSEGMGEDEKSRSEMRYDLGLAYQGAGNSDAAAREFQIVQRVNPKYRDIAVKIKDLKKGDAISLSQLKGDIEKEISSKFLEEGERIEREEKIRKNEKVRH